MKTLKLIFSILILYSNLNAQNKFTLRPSLGNGRAFNFSEIVYRSEQNPYFNHSFNRRDFNNAFPFSSSFLSTIISSPQVGFMAEYKISPISTLGVGIMKGRTEGFHFISIDSGFSKGNKFGDHWVAGPTKIGIEYTYSIPINKHFSKINILKKLQFSLLLGAFYLDNNQYGHDEIFTDVSHNNNVTVDSLVKTSANLNSHGFMLSGGIQLGILNKKKVEKISITFLYDQGLTNLEENRYETYYSYLTQYMKGVQIARGTQLKIYFSKPLDVINTYQKIKNKIKK